MTSLVMNQSTVNTTVLNTPAIARSAIWKSNQIKIKMKVISLNDLKILLTLLEVKSGDEYAAIVLYSDGSELFEVGGEQYDFDSETDLKDYVESLEF